MHKKEFKQQHFQGLEKCLVQKVLNSSSQCETSDTQGFTTCRSRAATAKKTKPWSGEVK